MAENFDIFDFMGDEGLKYKPIKSTDWKWSMKDDYPKEKNGLKVFSCFACGGGSTMGYKLAGCDVLGCVEIDPKMNEVYVKNHHPKYNYVMDIRKFNEIPNEELPEELFNLDILDGSPPCTTFSMAGDREESWGKKKKFREGQAEQTLDDLSFIFIETVAKLKPKCVIMENVEGLIKGEAWAYVQKIYKQLHNMGYKVKHWLLKGEQMGIPQKRHRVFFIAVRNDVGFDIERLDMSFNYEPVTYGEIKEGSNKITPKMAELFDYVEKGEKDFVKAWNRKHNPGKAEKQMLFNAIITYDDDVMQTVAGDHGGMYDYSSRLRVSDKSVSNATTFPQDYDFGGERIPYICGMSVPPIMMKRVVTRLIESGIFNSYQRKKKMNILVVCEESQAVCKAFREKGHEAYSCDIQECSGGHPEWHIQGDALKLIYPDIWLCSFEKDIEDEMLGTFTTQDGKTHELPPKWDMIIAFPPCTYLSNAGACRLYPKKGQLNLERYQKGLEAKEFFLKFLNADCARIAIENPVSSKIYNMPQHSQEIQPWMFGHPYTKKTRLWLRGLPPLEATNIVEPVGPYCPSKTSRKDKNGYGAAKRGEDAKNRAKTFPGIAEAMAEQWG